MAKDFCFLFYPGDYLRDTQCLSPNAQVAYDRIMCEMIKSPFINDVQYRFFTKRLSDDEKDELNMVLKKNDDGYIIEWVYDAVQKRKAFTESRRKSRQKTDNDNVRIYIVRDNVRSTYKIGSSVNPLRRYNELANQKNPAIMHDEQNERDISLIWYSGVVQRTEEKKLHEKFSEKNIMGEWFLLNQSDLNEIFLTYDGTYVNRTEIENEKEKEIVIDNEIEITKKNKVEIKREINSDWPDEKKREYILHHYPSVLRMQKPLTEEQLMRLLEEFGRDAVHKKMEALENKKDAIKKYKSAFLTLRSWCRDFPDISHEAKKQSNKEKIKEAMQILQSGQSLIPEFK